MTTTHPTDDVLARYAAAVLDPAAVALSEGEAAAVEDHELACPTCRARLGALARHGAAARLDRAWWGIEAELVAPRPRWLERALRRLGVGSATARLLVATPALRRAWFVAMGLALLFGLAAADPNRPQATELWFLLLAPLLPVGGVALAYGPGSDPAHDVVTATPLSGFRLVVLRSLAVVATAVGVTAVASLALAEVSPWAAAWLLPALAASAASVALLSWWPPRVAGAAVAGGWLAVVAVAARVADDGFAAFSGPAQVAWAVAAVAAMALAAARRSRYGAPAVRT